MIKVNRKITHNHLNLQRNLLKLRPALRFRKNDGIREVSETKVKKIRTVTDTHVGNSQRPFLWPFLTLLFTKQLLDFLIKTCYCSCSVLSQYSSLLLERSLP
jgi:hypothetical protein